MFSNPSHIMGHISAVMFGGSRNPHRSCACCSPQQTPALHRGRFPTDIYLCGARNLRVTDVKHSVSPEIAARKTKHILVLLAFCTEIGESQTPWCSDLAKNLPQVRRDKPTLDVFALINPIKGGGVTILFVLLYDIEYIDNATINNSNNCINQETNQTANQVATYTHSTRESTNPSTTSDL